MLIPSSNTPANQAQLLDPINHQRALEIANAHIQKPEYESTIAWYHVGRQTKFDFEAIRQACHADKVDLSLAYIRPGNNFITQFIEFEYYNLRITNAQTVPSQLLAGGQQFPLGSIQVYNAGNIQYAGILFDTREAQVKPEFIPELERQGFTCWKAGGPHDAIFEGPFRNVETLDEAFGPGAKQWMEDYLKGDGPECLIINR